MKQEECKNKIKLDNIDLLKALAIYFVIIYHFNNIPVNIIEYDGVANYFNLYFKSIISTCVPIFFFVNGSLLLNKEKIDVKKHTKKIIKIMILTLVWGAILLMPLMYIRGEIISFTFIDILKGSWVFQPSWNYSWFLCALIMIYVFYPLIYIAYHSNKKVFFFFFACVMFFTFGKTLLVNFLTVISYLSNIFTDAEFHISYITNFNPFNQFGYSIGYFMLGGLMGKMLYSVSNDYKKKATIMAFAALPISTFCLFLYAIIASLRNNEMWDPVWSGYDTIFTLINVIALYIISMHYKSVGWFGKFINVVGKNSLGIYLTHIIAGYILKPFFVQLECSTMLIANIIYAFIILLCSLLLTITLKKIPVMKYLVSI